MLPIDGGERKRRECVTMDTWKGLQVEVRKRRKQKLLRIMKIVYPDDKLCVLWVISTTEQRLKQRKMSVSWEKPIE